MWQKSPPPPRMREIFLTPDLSISGNFRQLWFLWQKSPPPLLQGWGKIFWHQIYPFQAISSDFGFCSRKAPPWDGGNFIDTRSIHFRQFWATLVFVAEKPPLQDEGKFFDTRSIHFRQFEATLVFCGRKAPPPQGKIFWHQIYPFQAILSNFGFCGRKAPPPPNEGNFFDTRSIHFRQFRETLVLVAEKPPPPDEGKNFWHQIYPFQAILSNFGFCGRRAPHPPGWGKFFWHQIYPFQAISGNFGFCGRKAPPPNEGNFFDTRSIHFRQFRETLVLVAEKPPPRWGKKFLTPDLSISGNFKQLWFLWQKSPSPPRMREIFLTPDLSISGNFRQLWFLWQKSPPPPLQGWGKNFWHQIYPFQAISSDFGFCGRKAPPLGWGKFFDTRSIHLRQFWATLVFVAEKPPPPPRMREIFWHQIYPFQAILSNFGFCGRKAHPPDEGKFLTPALSISGNFEWLWFLWQKSPPSRMRENSLTPDLSISGNLKQPWFFVAEKPLPPEGKFFDTRSIHFRQFWATLVFVAVEPLPQWGWGKIFWHQIYPFQAILSDFGFCGRKAPPPQWGKFFWHQIYPFQAILRNFGFGGRKAPPRWGEKILTPDLSISGNFKQLWFLWQKSPPPPRMREIFLTPDLSISGNFRQLWFLWQKSPPPYSKDEGKFFDTRSIHFRQFRVTLVFVAEKPPPWDGGNFIDTRSIHLRQFWATLVFVAEKPPLQDEGKFFDTRSIHFRQFEATLVFVAEKPLPPKGKFFDTRSIHFRQFWATLVFVAVEPLPQWGWGKIFWHQIYPFQAILSDFGFCGRKAPPQWGKFFWHQIYPFQAISRNFGFGGRKAPPPQMRGKNFDTRSIHFRQF